MDPFQVSYVGALLAGVLSFVSPCVLPLVPAYLCFVGGTSLDKLTDEGGVDSEVARKVFQAALAFVAGFITVFVLLGLSATAAGGMIAEYKGELAKVAGVVIVLFGLHFAGVFRIGFLNFEKRVHLDAKPAGVLGSYVLGLAFAFGWTPCVGPILATILMVASTGESPWDGAALLATYGAGIGVPFLLAALAVNPFMRFMARFRRHMRTVEIVIGGLLVVTGILIFTEGMADIGQWLLETFPALGQIEGLVD